MRVYKLPLTTAVSSLHRPVFPFIFPFLLHFSFFRSAASRIALTLTVAFLSIVCIVLSTLSVTLSLLYLIHQQLALAPLVDYCIERAELVDTQGQP
jgi:hypothetical protein